MPSNIPRVSRKLSRLCIGAAALVAVASTPRAFTQSQLQTVSIPFMTTFAGLAAGATPANAVCSASLPVYSVSGTGAKYGDGCPATQASLSVPVSVAADKTGNIFISDQTHQIIRVVYNGTGNDALAAAIITANVQNPGLALVKGDIYTIAGGTTVAPTTHYCNGAGTGPQGTDLELDGCPGAQTYEQLNRGVAVDADGNVFLSNGAVYPTIRVFYVGGAKAAALIQLANPTVVPQPGYVYKIAGYGGMTLLTTGSSCSGAATDVYGDGCTAVQAYLNAPRGLVVDGSENVYFADQSDNVVRRIDGTTSIITEVAGCIAANIACAAMNAAGDGGPAVSAAVNIYAPYGVALDQYGNVFIAEGGSSTAGGRIRVVYVAGTLPGISTPTPGDIYSYAGGSATTGTPAQMATFQYTYGVSLDAAGYLYVTDYRSGTANSNHIWRVDPSTGNIIIFAGTGSMNLVSGQHCDRVKQLGIITNDSVSDGCPATQSYLNTPQGGVAFDANGNGYIADRGDNLVRKLSYNNVFPATAVGSTSASLPQAFYFPNSTSLLSKTATLQGTTTTEFASTTTANDNCPLVAALPATPITCVSYVAFTPAAAGPRNGTYNLVDATGTVATEAVTGTGTAPVLIIAPETSAAIGTNIVPAAISTDLHGNVYVSDTKNNQVLLSTVAGGAGTALLKSLGSPRQSTIDSYGNLYVADSVNNNIVKLTAGSTTSTTFGSGLSAPQGIVADLAGNVYIADTGNNRLLYYNTTLGTTTPVSTYPITLIAPTALALDPAGNLYVIDTGHTRVVELPIGLFPTLMTLPVGVTPSAIAFDAGGDIYWADTASGSILFSAAGSTATTPVLAGFGSLAGAAVSPASGNVFVADSSATSALGYNVTLNSSTFTTTNIPSSSLPITLTLTDTGNAAATFAKPPFVETGSTAFVSYGTPTCAAGFVLAAGSTCTQAFIFNPTAAGLQTAKVVFNTTSGQSVTANFSATATSLIGTTLTIAHLNATANYGQTATYTVTLTPSSLTTPTPTGTVSFIVDGTVLAYKSVTASPYVYTFTLSTTVGMHSVAAAYTGDMVYGGSNAFTLLTIAKAVTTTTLSYQQTSAGVVLKAVVTPASTGAIAFTGSVTFYVDNAPVATVAVNGGALNGTATTTVQLMDGPHTLYAVYAGDPNYAGSTSIPVQNLVIARSNTTTALSINTTTNASGTSGWQFNAKVTSTGAGSPTGTVVFTNGSTVLGTATLTAASNGIATFFTTTTTYTSYTFTATYSGDGLFEPSISLVPEFYVVAPLTMHIPQGGQTSSSFSVAPVNGYTGSLTAVCTGLPINSLCRPYPTTITISGMTAVAFTVQIYAGVNPSVSSLSRPTLWPTARERALGTSFALLLAPLALGLRRRRNKALLYLLGLVLACVTSLGITGCGDSIKTPANAATMYTTPAGTYPIIITLTDTNGLSQANTFNIVVTP